MYGDYSPSVTRVAAGVPNARTCLLHQKLQLLNCCIEKAREGSGGGGGGNSSEDEFYDCSDEDSGDAPAGRLERLPDATLKCGGALYVPVTQVQC